MNLQNNKTLMILGMHRSGTSLFTNWLNACGLHIGDSLLGVTRSNIKGHYEDSDFVDFQNNILLENNTNWKYQDSPRLTFSEKNKADAIQLIKIKNQNNTQWGWKDPRTCLFLDFWNEIIPETHKIVIFRHYHDVVMSMNQRQLRNIKAKPFKDRTRKTYKNYVKLKLGLLNNLHLNTWCAYNENLLELIKGNKNILCLKSEHIDKRQQSILNHLTDNLGFDLTPVPFNSIYEEQLWHSSHKKNTLTFNQSLEQRAEKIWLELNKLEQIRFES